MVAFNTVHFHSSWDNADACGILLVALFLVHVYRLVYKIIVISREEDRPGKNNEDEGVSVIITAHNRADSLKENLIGFLVQDYNAEKYEVIVVDDCSEDDTSELLSRMQEEYPCLRCTRVHPDTKFRFTKKLAINIGVLSARHDVLLFSEADCYPASSSWAREMGSCFDEETAVVIGLSNFRDQGRLFSWKRYFRFARFLEMLFLCRSRESLLGDGCNMGYRKSFYMRNRGFAGNTQSYLGYDHDMARALAKYGKVKVCTRREGFMHVDERDEDKASDDTSRYFAEKARWPLSRRLQARMDASIRASIYILSLSLVCLKVLPAYALALAATVFLLDVVSAQLFARRFNQQHLLLTSLVAHLTGFAYRWYWHGYSFFNPKKWR
ncbi:MAG: glycosyltransferase [Odoribacteraceae bacterium]|jgi:cellulose synthase/poly-beta-1,6-N-acetylglucosamine synthase-like glycosyltransferase|nr:glycosyltransferase [Odoribacteraceae bacterium]